MNLLKQLFSRTDSAMLERMLGLIRNLLLEVEVL